MAHEATSGSNAPQRRDIAAMPTLPRHPPIIRAVRSCDTADAEQARHDDAG